MIAPILLLGYGNPSRGDDALAPLLLEQLADVANVEVLSDFQLQIEHALDLKHRQLVLFLDASIANHQAVQLQQLQAMADNSYTTHAMHPACVMQVYQDLEQTPPPPCFLLTMQAVKFELGAPLSDTAQHSLQLAVLLVKNLLTQPDLNHWLECCCA